MSATRRNSFFASVIYLFVVFLGGWGGGKLLVYVRITMSVILVFSQDKDVAILRAS